MKNFRLSITGILCMVITLLSSCDNHVFEDETWHRWRPGMIYCTNGEINTYEEVLSKGNTPEAVIFYVDYDDKIDGTAYAVCIKEHNPWAFSDPDTTYVEQGTSADISTFDGEKNTTAMRSKDISSPLAESLNPKYFIPSVAEMYQLYLARDIVNPIIINCEGNPIPIDKEDCWYWTSTECAGANSDRAWRYSLSAGRFESADKHQSFASRPILTIRLNHEEE